MSLHYRVRCYVRRTRIKTRWYHKAGVTCDVEWLTSDETARLRAQGHRVSVAPHMDPRRGTAYLYTPIAFHDPLTIMETTW